MGSPLVIFVESAQEVERARKQDADGPFAFAHDGGDLRAAQVISKTQAQRLPLDGRELFQLVMQMRILLLLQSYMFRSVSVVVKKQISDQIDIRPLPEPSVCEGREPALSRPQRPRSPPAIQCAGRHRLDRDARHGGEVVIPGRRAAANPESIVQRRVFMLGWTAPNGIECARL